MVQSPPKGIYPLGTQPQGWTGAAPAEAVDPTTLVRSVTGAVVAVTAALRQINALLAEETRDHASLARAVAALNYAVGDQRLAASGVLERLSEEIAPARFS
jgi:hypothetical protein